MATCLAITIFGGRPTPTKHSARIPMLMRWPKGMLSESGGLRVPSQSNCETSSRLFSKQRDKAPSRPIDGRSLLSLVREEGRGWRDWIDLEHNICYSPANHWNALTDGRWKYIFHARDGEQQLIRSEERSARNCTTSHQILSINHVAQMARAGSRTIYPSGATNSSK